MVSSVSFHECLERTKVLTLYCYTLTPPLLTYLLTLLYFTLLYNILYYTLNTYSIIKQGDTHG